MKYHIANSTISITTGLRKPSSLSVFTSPDHVQRLLTQWAGISPKKFLQYLTISYAREQLQKNHSLEEIAHHAGLSGTSRLHDLFMNLEGMTPDQYRRQGAGITIRYGIHHSPFGTYLLALAGENRICSLQFTEEPEKSVHELRQQWAASRCLYDQEATKHIASTLFWPGESGQIHLLARGTPFQLKVWESLLRIPYGEMVSYQVVAEHIGNPGGLQAVGSAIGRNPIAILIPCHRVIKKSGQISEYRWGRTRKSALLGWEAAHADR